MVANSFNLNGFSLSFFIHQLHDIIETTASLKNKVLFIHSHIGQKAKYGIIEKDKFIINDTENANPLRFCQFDSSIYTKRNVNLINEGFINFDLTISLKINPGTDGKRKIICMDVTNDRRQSKLVKHYFSMGSLRFGNTTSTYTRQLFVGNDFSSAQRHTLYSDHGHHVSKTSFSNFKTAKQVHDMNRVNMNYHQLRGLRH